MVFFILYGLHTTRRNNFGNPDERKMDMGKWWRYWPSCEANKYTIYYTIEIVHWQTTISFRRNLLLFDLCFAEAVLWGFILMPRMNIVRRSYFYFILSMWREHTRGIDWIERLASASYNERAADSNNFYKFLIQFELNRIDKYSSS